MLQAKQWAWEWLTPFSAGTWDNQGSWLPGSGALPFGRKSKGLGLGPFFSVLTLLQAPIVLGSVHQARTKPSQMKRELMKGWPDDIYSEL